jgi:hypothetical protein
MDAYVKSTNGMFSNSNFYLAWEAFNQMGYAVHLFEEKDIDTCGITVDTPVFAGTTVTRKIIDKLGINYPQFDCYPEVLKPYYGRNIRVSTLGEVRNKFHEDGIKVFVKPIKPKEFTGVLLNSILDTIPLTNKPDHIPVYVCEPIDILTEYRVYVHDGDILGVKHYYGDWSLSPSKDFIETVIKNYKNTPVAYGIDFGVIKDYNEDNGYVRGQGPVNSTIVVEVNDALNLGNYGLDSIYYGEMLVARWMEVMSQHIVKKQLDKSIADQKDYCEKCTDYEKYGGYIRSADELKDFYYNNTSSYGDGTFSKTYAEYMVAELATERKARVMQEFASASRQLIDQQLSNDPVESLDFMQKL